MVNVLRPDEKWRSRLECDKFMLRTRLDWTMGVHAFLYFTGATSAPPVDRTGKLTWTIQPPVLELYLMNQWWTLKFPSMGV